MQEEKDGRVAEDTSCKTLHTYAINYKKQVRDLDMLPTGLYSLYHRPLSTLQADRQTPSRLDVLQSFLLNSLPVPVVFTKMSRVLSRSVLPLTRLSLAIAGPPNVRQASEAEPGPQGSSATTRPAVLGSLVFQPCI